MEPASTTLILVLATISLATASVAGTHAFLTVRDGRLDLPARQIAGRWRAWRAKQSHPQAEQMINGVLAFRDLIARDAMVPRRDVVAVPLAASLDEVIDRIVAQGHSRLPVYDGNLDSIVGVLLAKDLLRPLIHDRDEPFELRRFLREPYFVPDTKPVADLLAEFRASSLHLAIVLDEFGGTLGIVTLEDLLEEIVGEIYDEYDHPEAEEFAAAANGDFLIDGRASIAEVNKRCDLALAEGDFDTIGGYIFGALGRIPTPGDTVQLNGAGALHVEETRNRRVTRIRFSPPKAPESG
jgi:putative hemolysin